MSSQAQPDKPGDEDLKMTTLKELRDQRPDGEIVNIAAFVPAEPLGPSDTKRDDMITLILIDTDRTPVDDVIGVDIFCPADKMPVVKIMDAVFLRSVKVTLTGHRGMIHLITDESTDIVVYSGKDMPGAGHSAEVALRSGTALSGSEPPAPLGDAEHQYVCDMWHEVTAGESPYISYS